MGMDVDYLIGKDAIEEIKDIFKRFPHGGREKAADELIEFAVNFKRKYSKPKTFDITQLKEGIPIVAKFGHNDVTGKPFEFLYEFGYYTKTGCVVYNQGECNMQDAHAFQLDQIRIATPEDLNKFHWEN